MANNSKTRYWTFVVYPDDIRSDWEQVLLDFHLPTAISPLHDKDKNPDDSIKKAHHHVIVCFEGPTTYNNVLESIVKVLGDYNDDDCKLKGITIPKRVLSLRGMYRYLTHLDNPEKYQYDSDDIKLFNDFNLDLTDTEINLIKIQITKLIESEHISNYAELLDYYRDSGYYDEFDVVAKHVYFFTSYINAKKRID